MSKKFDLEQAAYRLKTLHRMMDDANAGIDTDTWEEATDRLDVLLAAMEPLVNGLYEHVPGGGAA